MPERLDDFLLNRPATADRPLAGQTILVVEDSRFASEALRLLCLRSGARVRRADSLTAAARHLGTYRPSVVIVDLGLPDGNGAKLIADLAAARPRIGAIFATSGDDGAEEAAMAAGADAFLPKPLKSLAGFQAQILAQLPDASRPKGPRPVNDDRVQPDRLALQDDLAHVAATLAEGAEGETADYLAQFLGGIARSADDGALEAAAKKLADARRDGIPGGEMLAEIKSLLDARLGSRAVL